MTNLFFGTEPVLPHSGDNHSPESGYATWHTLSCLAMATVTREKHHA